MERAIPCELPFFYFRSAQFNSSKNITFVPNLQEIFKVVKRTFLYINLVIALFFVLPVSQAKEKTFTVVIDAGHGGKDPGARGSSINEYHEGDDIVGIDADIAQAICDKLGYELKIEDMEFDSILPAVQSGKADFGAAGMTVTEDRKSSVDFTDTYADASQVIIVKK